MCSIKEIRTKTTHIFNCSKCTFKIHTKPTCISISDDYSNETIKSSNTAIYPAQTYVTHFTQPVVTNNTVHTNPPARFRTCRNLSRPPIPTIPNIPFSYSLTSFNIENPQQTSLNNTHNFTVHMNSVSTSHPSHHRQNQAQN